MGVAPSRSAAARALMTTSPWFAKPFAGLTVRDHVSGQLKVTHIAPGPLEGRGYRSPKILRGDTVVSANGKPMNAQQFNDFIAASKVGDVVTLEVKRTGSTVVSGSLATQQSTGGKRTITVDSLRFLSADVAIADGRYDSIGRADGTDQRMLTSMVLRREGGAWKIAAIRNMLPTNPQR